jgi:hypothetical protein
MKKINKYLLSLILLGVFSLSSCDKFLDVNEDPINPTIVSEDKLLTGIQANFSFRTLAGDAARIAGGFTQQTIYTVVGSYDDYNLTENETDNFWNSYSYAGVMTNCKILVEQAEPKNKQYYVAIAKIIWAQNMAMITDAFGNAPFSQAWQPELYPFPAYDRQEEIYVNIQRLLDEAIAHIDNTDQSAEVPAGDDLIYNGDMQKWRKYAHNLKARYYMRLSYAPGYDAQTQAQLVIGALTQGFQSNDDNALYQYSNRLLQENPWNQYAVSGRWNTFTHPSTQYIANISRFSKDIRLVLHVAKGNTARDAFITTTNSDGSTEVFTVIAPYSSSSPLGVLYASPDAPLPWAMYSEAKFLEAEALFLSGNKAASIESFTIALDADFQFIRPALNKISKTPTDEAVLARPELIDGMINFYVNTRKAFAESTSDDNYYNELMLQKYITNYLTFEAYNDQRRTGYPILNTPTESLLDDRFDYKGVAKRFPYPTSEWQYNPRNVGAQNVPLGYSSMLVPVWWDSVE